MIAVALLMVAVMATILTAGMASASVPVNSDAPPATTPKTYFFTWYDSKLENGMGGDWIVIGNLEDYSATAQVYFGTESTPRTTVNLGARGREVVSWPDTMGGPVRVVSPSGAAFVVTQRVLYHDSFNEVAAIEEKNLDSAYYFTWYDSKPENGMKGNWILATNVDSQPASVDIYVGNTKIGHYDIDPGQQITPHYSDKMDGPVRVESTNGQKIIASQRVLCNDGFNEVTGMPASQLDSVYYFTWYDMRRSEGMKGNWVLISNLNDTPVHAQIYIGTSAVPKGTYTVGPHESVTPTYPDLRDGPVRVICTDCAPGQNIMVSQRVLYRDSFEEVQGTPPAGLSDQQFFGWYDSMKANDMTGNWILISNQGVGNATVDVYLGSSTTPLETYTIAEGDRVTPQYPETIGGPVRVESRGHQPLMVSQRVLYKESFNELLGLTKESVGLPISSDPELSLMKINTYWASYAEYEAGQLSVDMRLSNTGQGTAVGASITSVSATAGVTALTPMPLPLGDIAGTTHTNFTLKYHVPGNVTTFSTSIQGQCQDVLGTWFYYP
jgi:hypothetical protein